MGFLLYVWLVPQPTFLISTSLAFSTFQQKVVQCMAGQEREGSTQILLVALWWAAGTPTDSCVKNCHYENLNTKSRKCSNSGKQNCSVTVEFSVTWILAALSSTEQGGALTSLMPKGLLLWTAPTAMQEEGVLVWPQLSWQQLLFSPRDIHCIRSLPNKIFILSLHLV